MTDHRLPPDYHQNEVKAALDQLRERCGDSDFGYRMQALFGHVLIRLGFAITEINTQGHPDVVAVSGDRTLHVQVKTSKHGSAATVFEFCESDCAGITGNSASGILALLDCAEPVRWVIVAQDRAKHLVGRLVHMATLRGDEDSVFSQECTEEFAEMVLRIKFQLALLPYTLLRTRALSGTPL